MSDGFLGFIIRSTSNQFLI